MRRVRVEAKPNLEAAIACGVQSARIVALFEAEEWSLGGKRKPGQLPLHQQLRRLVRELTLFEERQQTPPAPCF